MLAEVDVAPGAGFVPAAGDAAGAVVTASKTFEAALQTIAPAAASLATTLRKISPGEVQIEFGLKLSADAGAFFASAGAESTFKVKLTWKDPTPVKVT